MRINHNIQAINAYRQLAKNQGVVSKHLEKLSSGLRINRAADDAAGLAISEKMRSQIRGLSMAEKNALDGISLIQTAEGALDSVHNILQRMRELAVQASNGTYEVEDRAAIQNEINQLTSEINRIGNTMEFNTKKLLDGTLEKGDPTSAAITGAALSSPVQITSTATSGTATGSMVLTPVEIHSGVGASATGNITWDNTLLSGSPINISAGNNEITLTVNGTTKTIALTVKTYDGSPGNTRDDFLADLQTQLDLAFTGANQITASFDSNNKLVLTNTGTQNGTSSISVDGGGAAPLVIGTASYAPGKNPNNTITITVDGVTSAITIPNGNYADATSLATALQSAINGDATLSAAGKSVTVDGSTGSLVIKSNSTGSNSSVGGFTGAALPYLGLSSASLTTGLDANNTLSITIDGESISFVIPDGTYNDPTILAGILEAKINQQTTTAKDVKVEVLNNRLVITSGAEGSNGSISVTDDATAEALGLSTSNGAIITNGADGANTDLKIQIGASEGQQLSLSIRDMRAKALGISGVAGTTGFTSTNTVNDGTTNNLVEAALDFTTPESAAKAITTIQNAIDKVSEERAKLGAFQNRLEHTINNLSSSAENLTAAESRIRDADMAMEMTNFTKNNIINQAAQAMLAQANQLPQGILQLLK